MRIVAGQYKGRRLLTPKNKDIRPTSDKIRGAIFNMLDSRNAIKDANVLDGFCGTGALGLEALSRGAGHCTFHDKSRDSLNLAQENVTQLGALKSAQFYVRDTTNLTLRTKTQDAYNLVFLDPPYVKGLIPLALNALIHQGWIEPYAWIICETEKAFTQTPIHGLTIDAEKTYGETKILLMQYQPIIPV